MKTSITFVIIAAVALVAVTGIALASGIGAAAFGIPTAYGGGSGMMGGNHMGGGMMGGYGYPSHDDQGSWNCPMYDPDDQLGGYNDSYGYCPYW